ncbi:MAG: hypothetical protein MZV64_12935 [Ignavibacteriales bacterium]|nr:hypothetical protein [Ignavibacteriales bacterium]
MAPHRASTRASSYLAASGFFFGIFVPRGLFGFPLVGHVMAGALFAVSPDRPGRLQGPAFHRGAEAGQPEPRASRSAEDGHHGRPGQALGLLALRLRRIPADALGPAAHAAARCGRPARSSCSSSTATSAVLSAVAAAVYLGLEVFAGSRPPSA